MSRSEDEIALIDTARAELLSLVTHELRTPLAVLSAYVELLSDAATGASPAKPADLTAWREAAMQQVGRLNLQIDSILTAARPGSSLPLQPTPMNLGEVTGAVIREMGPLLRNHSLRWEQPEPEIVVLADESRFRQVLGHLIENEAKYAPIGEPVSIGCWVRDRHAELYLTDDGVGIPREDWEEIFEAFVRRTQRPSTSGSGIGLYAARRLMGAMGGAIRIEPNGFGGSRFLLTLPLAPVHHGGLAS
ncbi:sensor histidine kinase [bacterium]|nr:sensor histidine kinase [bacterium]